MSQVSIVTTGLHNAANWLSTHAIQAKDASLAALKALPGKISELGQAIAAFAKGTFPFINNHVFRPLEGQVHAHPWVALTVAAIAGGCLLYALVNALRQPADDRYGSD